MYRTQSNFSLLISRLGLLFSIYFFCRVLFFIFNYSHFETSDFSSLASAFFYGMRYDITAIVISNILFIILHLLPFPFFYSGFFQKLLKAIFLIVNIPFLLFSLIDVGLFRFTGKRSGSEILHIMSYGQDFMNTAPKMIVDFWYLLLLFFGCVFVIAKAYPALGIDEKYSRRKGIVPVILTAFVTILFAGLTFIGFRGGIQYKPLNVLSASKYGYGKTSALILNTPFTILKTFGKQYIEEHNWMSQEEAIKVNPLIKVPSKSTFEKKNVVILILESFGKEYIGSLNNKTGYTPFLDSLMKSAFNCTNAYANGKRSIEGIPAILAGIPALMDEPFITSVYSGNYITSIASLLKTEGYSSEFFHGGTNGTMNFDNFAKMAGYEKYFGRTEYANDKDFDGNWGIYDEPFLQRSAVEMNKMSQPFLSTVFTLTSHHPYKIPADIENNFQAGTLPIHRSIGYTDYSLRKFFETVSKMPWYNNTLFVITADHTALAGSSFYYGRVGLYSIPILYYCPSDSALTGVISKTTQHIDILPSIMDYLGYQKSYFAFGESVFDKSKNGFAVNYMDQSYELIQDSFAYNLNLSDNSLYNFTNDSTLQNNLIHKNPDTVSKMDKLLKAIVQNYNHSLINNKMR